MNWESFERIGLVLTLIAFAVLGWFSWRQQSISSQLLNRLAEFESRLNSASDSFSSIDNQQSAINNLSCDADCIRKLVDEAIASVSGITTPQKEQVVERVVEKVTAVGNLAKTQYVPLGSGETIKTEWTTMAGAEVTFDISDLGQVSQVYFEAQISSPNSGLVYARIWDKRTGNMIYGSEISNPAGDAKLVSAPVTIAIGGRTISVQLRSENGQLVKLLSSRLRVDTK